MNTKSRNGFTLVEVIITLALFALLLTLVTSAVVNCMRGYRKSTEATLLRKKASMVLSVLSADIAKANAIYCPLSGVSPTSDRLYIWVPDIYANEDDLSTGGDLQVYYIFQDPPVGALRRITRYDNTVVADGIKSIEYSAGDSNTWLIDIKLTVANNVNDPASMTYFLSTAICRRGTMPLWEFGP